MASGGIDLAVSSELPQQQRAEELQKLLPNENNSRFCKNSLSSQVQIVSTSFNSVRL